MQWEAWPSLAPLHSDRVAKSKVHADLRNGRRLGVNCSQPLSREIDKGTFKGVGK